MTVERKHREEALNMWCHWDYTKVDQADRRWVETGEDRLVDSTMLILVATALAQRDARIAELESSLAALKQPGTVAVELGDSTTVRALAALSYVDDEGETCRPLAPVGFQGLDRDAEYTLTLLLTPVGE